MNIFISKLQEISLDNKYTKTYLKIIEAAQLRSLHIIGKKPKKRFIKEFYGYCEVHHILPKSFKLFEDINNPDNLVYITAREHYILHLLLTKMFLNFQFNIKMLKAFTSMKTKKDNRCLNSRLYDLIKNKASKFILIFSENESYFIHVDDYYENKDNITHQSKNKCAMLNIKTNKIEYVDISLYKSSEIYVSLFKDKVNVIDTLTNKNTTINKEEFKNCNGRYITHHSNKVKAKNIITNQNILVSKDEFYSNDNLISVAHGTVPVKNKLTNKIERIKTEDYNAIIHDYVFKDKIAVFDEKLNKYIQISTEEYQKGNYKMTSSGKTVVYDKNGKSHQITIEEYQNNKDIYTKKFYVLNILTNEILLVSSKEYSENDNYILPNVKTVNVIDKNSNCKIKISKELFLKHTNLYIIDISKRKCNSLF